MATQPDAAAVANVIILAWNGNPANYTTLRSLIVHALDAYARERERATWEAAASVADGYKQGSSTGTNTRDLWRADMAHDLAIRFRARAALSGGTDANPA
jgi:metal-dependent HD superfamily phosphatase/phosphodiesterase